ncbi:hypothetical protein [Acinetobacter baumannii]|uniref:hypothetical protein n=1 Tax=Acinetobacter baumannii TaxID=470 RepID=UPI003D2FC14E
MVSIATSPITGVASLMRMSEISLTLIHAPLFAEGERGLNAEHVTQRAFDPGGFRQRAVGERQRACVIDRRPGRLPSMSCRYQCQLYIALFTPV